MELDTLKSDWKKMGAGKKDQKELLMMTKIKNHPNIKRIRIKFAMEAILLVAFLCVYYDGFDGDSKPLWANVLLIGVTAIYIIIRFIGFLALRNPINEGNLKKSLSRFLQNLKRMATSILLTSLLFGVAIISFFASSVNLTKGKYFMLAGMILSLMLLVYVSRRNWLKRIEGIKTTLAEFNETADQ